MGHNTACTKQHACWSIYVMQAISEKFCPHAGNMKFNTQNGEWISTDPHIIITFLWRCDPTRAMATSVLRFLDHTQRRTTVGRTPLDEWSARRRDLYVTTHNSHKRQTSIPLAGFEATISAGEWPKNYVLYHAATCSHMYASNFICKFFYTSRATKVCYNNICTAPVYNPG